jgi:hypothetical protein
MSAAIPDKISDELRTQQTFSEAATAIYETINSCSGLDEFHEILRLLWIGYGNGKISDGEADHLSSIIERRRASGHRAAPKHTKALGGVAGRLVSRFTPRQRQRSPDRRASRNRRRMLGGSGALPNNLRHHYTEGQRSTLCIVAGEVKRHGICDFPIDKIAALAGVCRTTVQTALHEARRQGHIKITERPQRGRKNLPNVVEIISPVWRAWVRRGPSAARLIGSNSAKMVSPTKSTDLRKRVDEKKRQPNGRKGQMRNHLTPTPLRPAISGAIDEAETLTPTRAKPINHHRFRWGHCRIVAKRTQSDSE